MKGFIIMKWFPTTLKGIYRYVVVAAVAGLTIAQMITRTVDNVTLTIGWGLALVVYFIEKTET